MTLTMPSSPGFTISRFWLETNSRAFVSPLTRQTQTLELTGARWRASYALPPMTRAQAADWQSFLVQCMGMAERFYGFDPDAKTPRGAGGGTPVYVSASSTATILKSSGWPNSTAVLKAGDYLELENQLQMIISDVTSDGTGLADLPIRPGIRNLSLLTNGSSITITNPTCIMRLVDDDQAAWDASELQTYGISFQGVEAFGTDYEISGPPP